MSWINSSIFMFIFSVALYVCVRKSTLLQTPSTFNNLAMFALPALFYSLIAIMTNTNIFVTTYQLAILIIVAIFFSYFGNRFSLKSIEYAPNPGYSLILSKSYVVFTTIASVFLFNQSLTLKSVIAIAIIIGFSALIMINKYAADKSHVRSSWLPLSIGAFFCWGMLALSSKYLLLIGVQILPRLIFTMVIVSIFILIEMKQKNIHWHLLTKQQIVILTCIGLFSAAFNYFMQEGINTAPNVGYIGAVNASSIAALSFFSALIFKDELTKRKIVGIVGVTAGLILLVI